MTENKTSPNNLENNFEPGDHFEVYFNALSGENKTLHWAETLCKHAFYAGMLHLLAMISELMENKNEGGRTEIFLKISDKVKKYLKNGQ